MHSSKPDFVLKSPISAPIDALIEALPYGAAICSQEGKILRANSALARLLGLETGALDHRQASFLHPGILRDLDEIFSTGRFWSGDIAVLNDARETVPCHMTVSAMEWADGGETIPAALLTLMENTGHRMAQQDLISHNQERNDANATKTDFLANMGHELRTPLNAIIGNAELIAEGVLGDIDAAYRECGQDIHEAGLHLLALVNDVLDSAKLTDGAMKLKLAPANIITVARETVKIINDDFNRRSHKLSIDLPDHDIVIPCDRMKLKQVLINILTNAGKFTPDGGAITLALKLSDDEVIFTVADNGVGMAPQDIPRAMTRFSQLHPEGIKESAGTGLGLPLAKMLTELHGGRFIIESSPGKGTLVKICLPRNHAA